MTDVSKIVNPIDSDLPGPVKVNRIVSDPSVTKSWAGFKVNLPLLDWILKFPDKLVTPAKSPVVTPVPVMLNGTNVPSGRLSPGVSNTIVSEDPSLTNALVIDNEYDIIRNLDIQI